ncbi:MAG TPA: acyltransferase [Vicinamibacterales bacterium]|nr:acyltransferase [Vicinamibacterales bacterium]
MWRGVACLLVVIVHSSSALAPLIDHPVYGWPAYLVRHFWIGVPMFFVVSGYCIAATCDSSRRRAAPVRYYFARRLRRIYPPYWALLLLGVVFNGLAFGSGWMDTFAIPPLEDPRTLSTEQWLGNLTLTESVRFHFSSEPYRMFMGHAWTLAYEEQFYVVCGILLLVCPRRFFVGVAAVTVLTCFVAPLTFKKIGLYTFGFFFDGRWFVFAAGVTVYYALNYASPRGIRVIATSLFAAFIAAGVFFRWLLERQAGGTMGPDEVQLGLEFVVGASFALVLLLTHRWDRSIATARAGQPISWCGRMCYSVYLVHLPLTNLSNSYVEYLGAGGFWGTVLIAIPAGILISVAAGWVFFHIVEKRFLNAASPQLRREHVEPRPSCPVATV